MYASDHKRRTLNDLEAALNVNGNQRIARMTGSFWSESEEKAKESSVRQERDTRLPVAGVNTFVEEDEMETETPDLDIDFFPCTPQVTTRRRGKAIPKSHIFGQILSYRGGGGKEEVGSNKTSTNYQEDNNDNDEDEDAGYTRKRRRTAGLPLLEK